MNPKGSLCHSHGSRVEILLLLFSRCVYVCVSLSRALSMCVYFLFLDIFFFLSSLGSH